MPPYLSLIVSTRNRARNLGMMLESLLRLQAPQRPWELVLVDNASTDNTPDLLAAFAQRAPFPVRAVREERAGLSRARNCGVRASSGEVLLFTDDDCYPAEDYLAAYERVSEEFPKANYFGGRVLLHDPSDASVTVQYDNTVHHFEPYCFITAGHIHGANMACRRAAWEAVGGFDERLGPGTPFCCDDVEFLLRLSSQGMAGMFHPAQVVSHHHGRKPGPALRALYYSYAHGRGAYYAAAIAMPSVRWKALRFWFGTARNNFWKGNWPELAAEMRGAWDLTFAKPGGGNER